MAGGRGWGGRSHRGTGSDGQPWPCRGLPECSSGSRAHLCLRAVPRRVPRALHAVRIEGSLAGRSPSQVRSRTWCTRFPIVQWLRTGPGSSRGPARAGPGEVRRQVTPGPPPPVLGTPRPRPARMVWRHPWRADRPSRSAPVMSTVAQRRRPGRPWPLSTVPCG